MFFQFYVVFICTFTLVICIQDYYKYSLFNPESNQEVKTQTKSVPWKSKKSYLKKKLSEDDKMDFQQESIEDENSFFFPARVDFRNEVSFKTKLIDNAKSQTGFMGECTKQRNIADLDNLINALIRILDSLIEILNMVIPSSRCENACAKCDCTRAESRLIIVYEDPQKDISEEFSAKAVFKILNSAQNFILEHDSDLSSFEFISLQKLRLKCISNYAAEIRYKTPKSEFYTLIRYLQRLYVQAKFFTEVSDSISKFFDLSGITPESYSDFPLRSSTTLCRRHNALWNAPLISMVYLKYLHIELIELPEFANKEVIAQMLKTIHSVLIVENDESFLWEDSLDSGSKTFNPNKFATQCGNDAVVMRRLRMSQQEESLRNTFSTAKGDQRMSDYNMDAKHISMRSSRSPLIPNDPYFPLQWALSSSFMNLAHIWSDLSALQDIKPVVVGVIDSGLEMTHEDIIGNVWVNNDEHPSDGRDNDNNGYIDDMHGWDFAANSPDVTDSYGHGTKVTGIIAAVSNNNLGITSICPFCQIMVLKTICLDPSGKQYSSNSLAIEAIHYAVEKNVKVCNFSSFGISSMAFRIAIARAALADMIFVSCAGNSGRNLDLRENMGFSLNMRAANVVSVASFDSEGNLAESSNYGSHTVTIGAPGRRIWTTSLHNQYTCASGTSFATPHVTGVIAVLRGLFPELQYQEVIKMLIKKAVVLQSLLGKTRTGRAVNLFHVFEHYLSVKGLNEFEKRLEEVEKSRSTHLTPRDEFK